MELGKLQKVALREIWKHEALDFTNWLAMDENLSLLGEELGITFVSAQTEVSVGNFHLDILAEDETEHRVIIENQLESTNHDHLGKIITYASGLDAETIVWVVKRAREEHEQAITWLNEHTNENINFFLVQIEAWKIGNSQPAPRFNIIAKPNDWAKSVRQAGTGNKLTETKLQQQSFWEELREYGENHPSKSIRSWQKAQPQHWYNITIGSSLANLAATINSRENCVAMELYIKEKYLYYKIEKNRSFIEEHLGTALEWMELPQKKASRIKIARQGNFLDPKERAELIAWLFDNAVTFSKTFKKYI